MRKISVLLITFTITLFSCGDGDVIEFELDFDQDLELCGDINSENYLVYDVKTDPNESLILLFPGTTANDLIFYPQYKAVFLLPVQIFFQYIFRLHQYWLVLSR